MKNLLPTDQVLVQTIPMKDEQGNDKYWRTLPNGRIRVAITGPVEPLVQKDIDRLVHALTLRLFHHLRYLITGLSLG